MLMEKMSLIVSLHRWRKKNKNCWIEFIYTLRKSKKISRHESKTTANSIRITFNLFYMVNFFHDFLGKYNRLFKNRDLK